MKRYIFLALFLLLLAGFSVSSQLPSQNLLQEARHELYAGRYEKAVDLFSRALAEDPKHDEAYYGLTRAQLRAHHHMDAYASASAALQQSPNTTGSLTAAGMVAYRRGDLAKAEEYYRAALKADPNNAGAIIGIASICSAVSKFETARKLNEEAYRIRPDDPDFMLSHANTLRGAEHIAALEKVLAILDPSVEVAQSLKAHIATDRAIGDRKTARLVSAYSPGQIKLIQLQNGPSTKRGVGLRVQMNGRETVTLLLDTGASGVSISPGLVKKAALVALGEEASEAKGIGDKTAPVQHEYLVSDMRVGDLSFADYPVSVFTSAKSSDEDGIIGADVFRDFIVTIDFARLTITLTPRPGYDPSETHEPKDAPSSPAPGFYRALRFGNHLALPTLVNGTTTALFLIDSGASTTLIDTEVGKESTKVRTDERTKVTGIQGKVNNTSRADRVDLAFAGFRQNNTELVAINLDNVSDGMGAAIGGILGMPVLQQLILTIDYLEGTVQMERPKL